MIYYRTFFYLATMRTFGGTFPQPRSSWSLNVRPFIFLTASHLHLHVLALKMSNVIIIVSNDWKNFPPCTFLRKEDIFFLLCLNPVARGTHTSEPAWGSVRLRMVESWLESPPLESCFSRLKCDYGFIPTLQSWFVLFIYLFLLQANIGFLLDDFYPVVIFPNTYGFNNY